MTEFTYQEFIQNILDARGRFACGEEYHERHHILPKCMGGSNEEKNLIDLYAREHFEAHRLLALENPNVRGLQLAWTCMAFPMNKYEKRQQISPEEYEEAKRVISKVMSGRKLSDETKRKLSASKIGKPCYEKARLRASEVHKGVPFSDEHKRKLSESLKGRVFSDEHRANISKGKTGKPITNAQRVALAIVSGMNVGRKHSEETKAKMSAAQKGKVVSEESKKKMSESAKNRRPNRCIKIAQCDLTTGEVIKVWESSAEAHRVTGIDNSSILKCANGTRKHAGGFLWKFV